MYFSDKLFLVRITMVLNFSGAPAREARVGQSPILMEYGQPLFVWLSRDWPSVRTYVRSSVRTYASTDCTGRVGETIKRKGGVSQACLGTSSSFIYDTHNMVNWQLSKQDSHWPVSHDHIAGSRVNSSKFTWFIWKLSADQLIVLIDREQCSISYFY